MNDINWWLMALAFVLGLVLTLALMIRRVKREVPVYGALGRRPEVDTSATGAAAAAQSTGGGEEPYGPGSLRVAATATAPSSGYTIKGNEDSMLYHTTESPSYGQTIAEIWFTDEESALAAGFNRWDSGKSQRAEK